jgi:predicted amino acid-binding ACT domain protein
VYFLEIKAMIKSIKEEDKAEHNQLVGSVSWGVNRTKIFYSLCKVYKDRGLDIIDVESHVREGWFTKMILARNTSGIDFDLGSLRRGINKISTELDFESKCFVVPPEAARTSDREANVVIVLLANNKVGLLAEVLEILDKFNVDIIDIKIFMDDKASSFALNLQVYIQVDADRGFFSDLQEIREALHGFRSQDGLENFKYLVHSSETFDFIEKIDYEPEV